MGRPKTFDDHEVLDQVVACFRANGFESTSIRDLEAATGLKATSIYRAFGNKNAVFSLALLRYRTEVLDRRTSTYLDHGRGLDGIKDFFTSTYQQEPLPDQGCLFATAASEAPLLDPAARQHVADGLTVIQTAFHDQIKHCQAIGEVTSSVNAETASRALLMLYEGLLVLLRSGSHSADFNETVKLIIDSVLTTTLNTTKGKNNDRT